MPLKDTKQKLHLEAAGIYKYFGKFPALKNVSFQVEKGEFVTILGPSGCGKTTLLRVVAGLEDQSKGAVLINGRNVSGWPVARRNLGIVFQNYALFPNLTADDNVAYGLSGRKMQRGAIRERVDQLMELVGLKGHGGKYPAQLSGGQQQRVALARAMALNPGLLLLDEPLSALDARVRARLRGEIRELQQRLGIATIMVTHDQEEALTMADRILVMDQGELVQYAPPHEIYNKPATPFVASFIGAMNFLEGADITPEGRLRLGGRVLVAPESRDGQTGGRALVAIRPEDVMINPNGEAGPNLMDAVIRSMEYRGSHYRVRCGLFLGANREAPLEAEVASEKFLRLGLKEGLAVKVDLPPAGLNVYPADDRKAA